MMFHVDKPWHTVRMGQRNPAPVENGGKHPIISRVSTIRNRWFIGFRWPIHRMVPIFVDLDLCLLWFRWTYSNAATSLDWCLCVYIETIPNGQVFQVSGLVSESLRIIYLELLYIYIYTCIIKQPLNFGRFGFLPVSENNGNFARFGPFLRDLN